MNESLTALSLGFSPNTVLGGREITKNFSINLESFPRRNLSQSLPPFLHLTSVELFFSAHGRAQVIIYCKRGIKVRRWSGSPAHSQNFVISFVCEIKDCLSLSLFLSVHHSHVVETATVEIIFSYLDDFPTPANEAISIYVYL